MGTADMAAGPLAIDLNQPGSYLHWSIFNVSVANLVPDCGHGRHFRGSAAAAVSPRPPQRTRGGAGR
jgi:hypothetical protein